MSPEHYNKYYIIIRHCKGLGAVTGKNIPSLYLRRRRSINARHDCSTSALDSHYSDAIIYDSKLGLDGAHRYPLYTIVISHTQCLHSSPNLVSAVRCIWQIKSRTEVIGLLFCKIHKTSECGPAVIVKNTPKSVLYYLIMHSENANGLCSGPETSLREYHTRGDIMLLLL